MNCWSCKRAVGSDDRFCRFCGMGQGEHVAWYYRPVWIAILALFALGPFVLPLIWRTPRLEKRGRRIATALVALLTAYLIYSCYRAVELVKVLLAA